MLLNVLLRALQAQAAPLGFQFLRAKRLARLGRAPQNVGNAGQFVDDLLTHLPRFVELPQRGDGLLDGHQPERFLDVALHERAGGVRSGSHLALVQVLHGLYSRLKRSVVDAPELDGVDERPDAAREAVHFRLLGLPDHERADRDLRVRRLNGKARARHTEEAQKLVRVVFDLQRPLVVAFRNPIDFAL